MRFFFYGTLIAGSGNPMARLVEEVLRPLGPARTSGVLHGVPNREGWYPVLLPGEGEVHGMVYETTESFTPAHLARFDDYEDYDPGSPATSLYIREPATVRLADGAAILAETYRYNRPLPDGARPIARGDFRAWLVEQGLRGFRA